MIRSKSLNPKQLVKISFIGEEKVLMICPAGLADLIVRAWNEWPIIDKEITEASVICPKCNKSFALEISKGDIENNYNVVCKDCGGITEIINYYLEPKG